MSLKNRSFLKLLDYTPAEIEQLLELAADLKGKKEDRYPPRPAARQEHRPDL